MFIIITLMISGFLCGYFLRDRFVNIGGFLDSGINLVIYFLLLFLGISVGSNDSVITSLPEYGLQSFLFAVFGVLGSLICGLLVQKFFFKEMS